MAKRFNDGVIDLSSLREKKQERENPVVEYKAEYNPDAIMETVPQGFEANAEGVEGPVYITVMSVAIMPDKIYMIMHDGNPEEPPFLMIGKHENNAFTGDLTPATEEDLTEYNELVSSYRASIQAEEREAQFQEMLEKAESEEEREQIRQAFEQQIN